MSAKLLEGKPISEAIRAKVKADVEALKVKGIAPKLVAVLAGDNPGAKFYAGAQQKACEEVGISYKLDQRPAESTEAELAGVIEELNRDPAVHGIILLMPVPKGVNGQALQARIDPRK